MSCSKNETLPIPGFEDYRITLDGRLWSTKRNKWLKCDKTGKYCLYNETEQRTVTREVLLRETWEPSESRAATPKQVRAIRYQLGITRLRLAELLDVSEECIKSWETDVGQTRHRAIPFDKYLQLKQIHQKVFE